MANSISPFGLGVTSSPPPDWASSSDIGSAAVSPKVSMGNAGAREDVLEVDFAVDTCFDSVIFEDETVAPDASDTTERAERSDRRIVVNFVQRVLRLKILIIKATVSCW